MGYLTVRSVAAAMLLVALLTLGACAPVAQDPVTVESGEAPAASTVPAPAESAPAEPVETGPSPASIAYAADLGGSSHEGETLYVVIGASAGTEAEAQALLEGAIPLFGDMQSYFIIQRSDDFEGMSPGWWVVIEAYRGEPSPENLEFGRRAFADAYVRQVIVRTADPIPVYEDMLGE